MSENNAFDLSGLRRIKYQDLLGGIETAAIDEPGSGGACHSYVTVRVEDGQPLDTIRFQNGPVKENGINGVQNETLLAIVADRLEGFQAGPFACDDNAEALDLIEKAIGALQRRTRERMARGVEGTLVK